MSDFRDYSKEFDRCRGDPDREDALQEKAIRLLGKGLLSGLGTHWKHRVADLRKARRRALALDGPRQQRLWSVLSTRLREEEQAPDLQAIRREEKTRLEAAIRCLPPRFQAVMGLRWQEDTEIQRIASMVGRGTSTVRRWLKSAEDTLRRRFKEPPRG